MMLYARSKLALALWAYCALATPQLGAEPVAATSPVTMLLIDGSGSMWARLEPERRAKIDIVREHLTTLLAASPQSRIGLASYGHNRRGDCSDAEVIVLPDAPRDVLIDSIAKLNPRGKGPLAAGLAAAQAAFDASRPASLILVTDGVDNCRQDACAAAQTFSTTAARVPIHVVAVGVNPAEHTALSCIATATGGTFADAQTPETLNTALASAARLAMLAPAESTPAASATTTSPAAAPPRPLPAGATLSVTPTLVAGGERLTTPLHWKIFEAGGDRVLAESQSDTFTAKLDAGDYDIEADAGNIRVRQKVSIEDGKATVVELPLDAARISVRASNVKTGKPIETAAITILPDDGGTNSAATVIAHAGTADVVLPPGGYTVRISNGNIQKSEAITLAAGNVRAINSAFETGRLELTARHGTTGASLDDVIYSISEDDPESADGRREVARSRSPEASFVLPAGTYYVEARSGAAVSRQRVAVSAGETVKENVNLSLVPVKISATIAGAPAASGQGLVYRITEAEGEKREVARALQPVVELALLPGQYRIAAHLDAHHMTAFKDVTITGKDAVDIVIPFEAAEVSLKAQAAGSETYWEIADAAGKPVWRTQLGEPKALLAAGRYTVRFESRDRRAEAAFEVKAGEKRLIELNTN